ncbi:MAG: GntR family transcriptional regulator [Oligosphaeraceae bacterium]|nr:GntR family transcriptional regulator [Oligosphaeraceae bacterium]
MLVYQEIAQRLRREIKYGLRSPGALLPPETVFAEELGVSRKTLRKAFAELEQEGLITRRKHVGTGICADAAEKIRLSLRVGVVFSILGSEEALSASVLLASAGPATELQLLLRRLLQEGVNLQLLSDLHFEQQQDLWQEFDGLFFIPPHGAALSLRQAADKHFPHLNLENHLPYPGINTVMADDEQAAYECTRELLQIGHKQIAFIGGALQSPDVDSGFRRRTRGFLRAYADFSLTPSPDWIFNLENQSSYQMSELLRDYPARTAACSAVVAAVGHSVLELENLRRRHGQQLFPCKELRCIDLQPLHLGPGELCRLQQYHGYIKPRQEVATTAYEHLLQWIGDPDYQFQCHKIPFHRHIPVQEQKEFIYAEA